MSQTDSSSSEEIRRTVQIPSLLTNSLRAVLDAFGQKIIRLKASGSIETTNGRLLDDLRNYDVSWEQQDHQRVRIDYEQLPGADGPANPLTDDAQARLLEEVETRLGPRERSVEPDLAVTQCTLRITDERLQAVTPAQSPEFDLRFVSDPAEPPVREVTKRHNADRGLYTELGFDVRNLNLRSVIETETKFHEQANGKYLSWAGPEDIRPRSPERLAVRVNEHVLPDAYGVLKPYVVTDDRVLELGESVDEAVPDPQPFGGVGSGGEA
ncbi:hypothetical protein [Halovenus sp. HT40]|uniref:hypothetical protein n=1 Tax=Halovenus sp. HT40 TaxID=3126691 RepID=UPI00300ECD7F